MPTYVSEVIVSPGGEKPYLAILRIDGKVVASTPVDTHEDGEALLADAVKRLRSFEKK